MQQPWAFYFFVMLWCDSHFFAWLKAPYPSGWFHGITIGIFSVIPSTQQWLPTKSGKTQSKASGDRWIKHSWIKKLWGQLWANISKPNLPPFEFLLSEITANIPPPKNSNCLNIVNQYGSQKNSNFNGLKKYHKNPPSNMTSTTFNSHLFSTKNKTPSSSIFFHVVFLSSLSSPAPWAPFLEPLLSSAAEAEDHVLMRLLGNFNLEKSKKSPMYWKLEECGHVLYIENMHICYIDSSVERMDAQCCSRAMSFQVNSNSWVWLGFFLHISPWRSISATSRAMFLESSKPQWGLRQRKR